MKAFFISILFSFTGIIVQAQYGEGQADGTDKAVVVQINLNGIIGGVIPLYQGGAGDGFDKSQVSAYLNGVNTSILYNGGRGDGFVNGVGSFSINGTSLAALYSGGKGDGFDKMQYSSFLNNIGAIVLYNGGKGDGFDRKSYYGFINGTSTALFYSGGEGDGFSKGQIQAFLNGVSTATLYSGGKGDGFAKSTLSGVLPIQLLSFDATAKETYVLIKWVTETEGENSFFTIERSQNGVLFNSLRIVPANKSSQSVHVYTENDNDPIMGRSFYRLKWTGIEGTSNYSDIRTVFLNEQIKKDFLLFPNPNDGQVIYAQLDGLIQNEDISVSIADMQGKVIYKSQKPSLSGNRLSMNLSQKLAAGSYVVRVIRNGESSSKVLIVR